MTSPVRLAGHGALVATLCLGVVIVASHPRGLFQPLKAYTLASRALTAAWQEARLSSRGANTNSPSTPTNPTSDEPAPARALAARSYSEQCPGPLMPLLYSSRM